MEFLISKSAQSSQHMKDERYNLTNYTKDCLFSHKLSACGTAYLYFQLTETLVLLTADCHPEKSLLISVLNLYVGIVLGR